MSTLKLALVGATGAVGRQMLSVLEQRRFPASEVRAVATARSAGRVLPYAGGELTVAAIADEVFDGVDLAIFDTPDEAALEWVPRARARGVTCIDKSAAFRLEEGVPLVVTEINPDDAARHQGLLANPNCTAVSMLLPLAPLHRAFGCRRVIAASYQSVSGAGQPGVTELYEQMEKLLPERDAVFRGDVGGRVPQGGAFAHPIAFNVIPHVGSFGEGGFTSEERRMRLESRKILGAPDLDVFATCVRVPTVVSHGVAVWAEFDEAVTLESARDALQAGEGVVLEDDTDAKRYPTPLLASGKDKGYVGRLRVDPSEPHALGFFAACDNLRKGAALNAVQIAELLVERNLI